jgi:tetratricopeptide (TPR) repeat protein
MHRIRNILSFLVLLVFVFFVNSCSTKRNTFISRQYHNFTTHYNVYFNGKESLIAGEKKIVNNHKEEYSRLLPLFLSDDEVARKSAYSNMERAVIKAQKAIKLHSITRKPKRRNNESSKKYNEFRKKKEFNKYIDDCYLLIGKGNFYNKKYLKADKAFTFIARNFEGEPIVLEAKIWHIRSLTEQGKYSNAQLLINSLEKEKKMSSSLNELYFKSRADYKIKSGDISGAIDEVERLINISSSRKEKIRYRFILAQLYMKNNMAEMAMNLFRQISNMRISYDMAFNASINMALSYNGTDGGGIRRNLMKMLRDEKNRDYKDQIYYALGNLEFKDGNIEEGVKYLRNSTKYSVNNDIQKSISFRYLGDYYFERKDYANAYTCYDSCVYFNSSVITEEKELLRKKNNLSDLIENLNVVSRQDSLQRLALMTPKQRDKVIQKIIDDINKKEQYILQGQMDAQMDRNFYLQNRSDNVGRNIGNNTQGDWYFYNPVSISMGSSEFIRKWGRRKNEDNWRRKNKAIVDISNFDNEEWNGQMSESNKTNVDLKSKAFYLKNIPFTEEARKVSDSLIIDALFVAADIYKERFNDYDRSLNTYDDLIRRFPENKFLLYSYYNSYEISNIIGDYTRASSYKERLINKFPNSEYAKMLKNPQYMSQHIRGIEAVETMYEKAYKAYSNYSYFEAINIIDESLKRYAKNNIVDRLLMLRALCIGRVSSKAEFTNALKRVLKSNPGDDIELLAKSLISTVKKGAVPVKYSQDEVSNARFLRNTRNWDFKESSIVKNEGLKQIYKKEETGEFYFALSVPRTAKNIQRLRFQINFITEELIEQGFVQVRKENIGVSSSLFVVRGLKDKDEAMNLFRAIAESKKISNIIGKLDYRMFIITAGNYKILQHNQDVDVYVDFFIKKYLKDNADAGVLVGVKDRALDLFTRDMTGNHKFILMYPSKKVKTEDVMNSLKSYDNDYAIDIDQYDSEYDLAIVSNVGNRTDAVRYLVGFKNYLNKSGVDITSLSKMIVITDRNYEIFYSNKYYKEYSIFFEKNYKVENVDILNGKRIKDGKFVFDESSEHYFVIVYPLEVDGNKLMQGFKRYNIKDLGLAVEDFDEDRRLLLVSNLKDKKQGMMYFRAVITNRKLFKEIKDKDYRNFVISEENLKVLKRGRGLKEYMVFFKKWYLNR